MSLIVCLKFYLSTEFHCFAFTAGTICRAAQLGLVMYTIIITCIVFATFGFRKFGAESFPGEDEEPVCESTLTCFWYIFYVGVPGGGISDLMNGVTVADGETYWSRILYDLIFFVWMGVLLFNVITGLIVDTFGSLREDANARMDTLENSCFICGIVRSNYDDKGLPPEPEAPSFDSHINEEHNIWSYVNFLSYLMENNPNNFDGREKFVFDQIKDALFDEDATKISLSWLPNRTSLSIEVHEKSSEDDEEDEKDDAEAET